MSIASSISAAQGRVADCYTAISAKGGTLPATQNLSNMPTAIGSIPSGSAPRLGVGVDAFIGDITTGTLNRQSGTYTIDFSGVSKIGEYALAEKFRTDSQNMSFVLSLTNTSGITEIKEYGLYYAFSGVNNTGSIDLSGLTTIGNMGLGYTFSSSYISGINLSDVITISNQQACLNTCASCSYLSTVSLSSLETISGTRACQSMFSFCGSSTSVPMTVNIGSLKTISGQNACQGMFSSCIRLETVSYTSLDDISGSSALYQCYQNCSRLSSIYFNALKTTSFGSFVNQFSSMFNASTASTSGTCTVHFPSNLQSTISGLTGYPTFGGTASQIVLAFDLPATEVDLTVNLTGNNNAILNGFTINGTTYPYSSFSGDGLNNTMTIKIPANKSLSWTATCARGTLTPSSGTINTSSNYTLNITCYDPSIPT